ncbi:uncharacterized protein Dmul_17750 [Desulfococcus multivorans]|nr:uncharacterized protein Dmul_17750 [Desulfococcus multivorans]
MAGGGIAMDEAGTDKRPDAFMATPPPVDRCGSDLISG